MISKFKKNTYKFTAVSLSAALLVGGLVFTNPVRAKTDETQIKYVNDINKKDMIEGIVDNYWRGYFNVDRLVEDVDFKFMLPKYLPNDYKLEQLTYVAKNGVKIYFRNVQNAKESLHLIISERDPEEYWDDISNRSITEKKEMSIAGVKGQEITVDIYSVEESKYFVFQKDNIYYNIEYQSLDKDNNILAELPLSELAKMVESLDYVDNIDKKAYEIPSDTTFIYNTKDMKNAREKLGYDFKLPIDTSFGEYTGISVLEAEKQIEFRNVNNFILYINKEVPYYYDQFTKGNKLEIKDSLKDMIDKMEGEWVQIDNKKVLKVTKTYKLIENQTQPDKDIDYYWCDDDVYYLVHFYPLAGQEDNIDMEKTVENIIESKSFDEVMK